MCIRDRHDTSAVTIVHQLEDERWAVEAEIFVPPEDGELDLAVIENYIMGLHDRYEVQGVVFDRWAFSRSSQDLASRGAVMIEFPMTNERTVPACSRLLEAVNRGELVHNGDQQLEAHVEAGSIKMTERGWRIAKAPRGKTGRGKIDALIALLLAFTVATQQDGGSVYDEREMIVI